MPQQLKSALVLLLAVLAGGSVVFGVMQFQRSQQTKQNSVLAAQQEIASTLKLVARHMELPGETPTIATVSDSTKLQGQPFFKNAKNGDKVLIYTQAREAILYRPSSDKIISVAPVNLQNPTATQSQTGISTTPTNIPTPTRVLNRQFLPTHEPNSVVTPLPSSNP